MSQSNHVQYSQLISAFFRPNVAVAAAREVPNLPYLDAHIAEQINILHKINFYLGNKRWQLIWLKKKWKYWQWLKSKRILGKGLKLNEKLTTHFNPQFSLSFVKTPIFWRIWNSSVFRSCEALSIDLLSLMCWRLQHQALIPSTLTSAGSTGKNKAANYPPILLSVKIAEWENQTNLKIMRKMFSVFANVAQGVKTVTAVKKWVSITAWFSTLHHLGA